MAPEGPYNVGMSFIHVVLMRHGRSGADDENVHEGRYDSPLTEVGLEQARLRVKDLREKNLTFNAIISSTLQRARATAQVIAEAYRLQVEPDAAWMEMDNGPLAGLPFAEAERLYPKPDFRNPYQNFFGTGESQWDIYARAGLALQSVVRRGPGSYLVVAHGMVLTAALWTICGTPPPVSGQGLWFGFGDTGYAILDYYPERHVWVLRAFVAGFSA